MIKASLTPRERVRVALAHRETDRTPIAMVCSGINPGARGDLEAYLNAHRGITVDQYLAPLIDIKDVWPDYRGPVLPRGTDIWGVRRQSISYGPGAYEEIEHSPLANATTVGEIENHRWPDADWFDYESVPRQIAALDAREEHCIMVMNGNIFESSWYMRGFENIFMDLATEPEIAHALF